MQPIYEENFRQSILQEFSRQDPITDPSQGLRKRKDLEILALKSPLGNHNSKCITAHIRPLDNNSILQPSAANNLKT